MYVSIIQLSGPCLVRRDRLPGAYFPGEYIPLSVVSHIRTSSFSPLVHVPYVKTVVLLVDCDPICAGCQTSPGAPWTRILPRGLDSYTVTAYGALSGFIPGTVPEE